MGWVLLVQTMVEGCSSGNQSTVKNNSDNSLCRGVQAAG